MEKVGSLWQSPLRTFIRPFDFRKIKFEFEVNLLEQVEHSQICMYRLVDLIEGSQL